MSCENLSSRSNINGAVQPQKMARDLKFRISEVEGFILSKNKGTDQLRGYRAADLRLCFRICKTEFRMTRFIFEKNDSTSSKTVL